MGGKFMVAFIAAAVYFMVRPMLARTTGLPV